jgi:RNA polymerase sigma-70 factor (ECF subfamily)
MAARTDVDAHAEFMTLFLRYQGEVKAFIGSVVRDRHARDDLFQEVALVLWEKFGTYQPGRSFGAWARGIAAKKVLQRWEKIGRLPLPFAPDTMQALLDAFERTEPPVSAQGAALEQCMAELPDRSRRLLALRYDEALSLDEIARQVGSTLDAVHKALSRLRARLQECVARRLAASGEALP